MLPLKYQLPSLAFQTSACGLSSPVPQPSDPTSSPRSRRGVAPHAHHVTAGRCPPCCSPWGPLCLTLTPPGGRPPLLGPRTWHALLWCPVCRLTSLWGPTASRGEGLELSQSFGPGTSYSCRGEHGCECSSSLGFTATAATLPCVPVNQKSALTFLFFNNEFILKIKNQSASAGGRGFDRWSRKIAHAVRQLSLL